MEREAAAFLKRVGNTLIVGFLWLAINVTAAIKGDNAFISDHVTFANVLFYIWFVASLVILIFIYRKIWGEKPVKN
jgi:hypothetical protein